MFKDRDIVCFIGDSITANGLWMAEVYQELRKKYKIKCYNCGVSGGAAQKVAGYLHSECLIYNPDHVVLMLGMNDLDRDLYSAENLAREDLNEKRNAKVQSFRENYEKIVRECVASGAEVTICLPTPYDEVSDYETERLFYQQALEKEAAYQTELAEKYGCSIVNFKDNMLPLLGKMNVIREDRVHPTEKGYHIMAQIFLKETGETDECDFDAPFVFEEWNRMRYEAEMYNHKLNFVELCATFENGYAKQKSTEEIKQIAKGMLDAYEGPSLFIPEAYREYIKRGHLRAQNKGEIVRLTIF